MQLKGNKMHYTYPGFIHLTASTGDDRTTVKEKKRPILSLWVYSGGERIITQRQSNLAPNKSSSLHS